MNIDDLVHQTSASEGTGNFSLSSVNGRRTFSEAFGTGDTNTFWYFISSRDAAEWELGIGYMDDSSTLVRDDVIKSSNSNAAVDFGSGNKDVTNDIPAASQLRREQNLADLANPIDARENLKIVVLSQGSYDALTPPDADTLYFIV